MPRKGAARESKVDAVVSAVYGVPTPIEPIKPNIWRNDRTLLAVDPGEVHIGLAWFVETEAEWECVWAREWSYSAALDHIAVLLEAGERPECPDILVVEEFRLYADMAQTLIGSDFPTAQFVGAVKYLHYCYEVRRSNLGAFKGIKPGGHKVDLVFQPASIQKPTNAILTEKGVGSEAHGNDHARSAELHGWHRILRENV